jgi:hypothetical protein
LLGTAAGFFEHDKSDAIIAFEHGDPGLTKILDRALGILRLHAYRCDPRLLGRCCIHQYRSFSWTACDGDQRHPEHKQGLEKAQS